MTNLEVAELVGGIAVAVNLVAVLAVIRWARRTRQDAERAARVRRYDR